MIRNSQRASKTNQIDKEMRKFAAQGCDRTEQIIGTCLELEEKARLNNDVTERASMNEWIRPLWPIYAHEKYGAVMTNREFGKLRREMEKYHPLLRVFKLPHDEIGANGQTVKRFYITILEGTKEVQIVNDRIDKETTGLNTVRDGNTQASNVKAVRAERKKYLDYLRNKKKRSRSNN